MSRSMLVLVVVAAFLAVASVLSAETGSTSSTQMDFRLAPQVGGMQGGGGSVSPLGIRVTGVDCGGCPDISSFMVDVVSSEIERGLVGSGFEVQTADVHCRVQNDGTRFFVVILGSGFPMKYLSARAYSTSGSIIDSVDTPVLEIREIVWGLHAIQYLLENGKVVRVAFAREDRYGVPVFDFWGIDNYWPSNLSIQRFSLISRDEDVIAITISQVPCDGGDDCPRGARLTALMEHGEFDEVIDSRVVAIDMDGKKKKEMEEPLMVKFESLASSSDTIELVWVR